MKIFVNKSVSLLLVVAFAISMLSSCGGSTTTTSSSAGNTTTGSETSGGTTAIGDTSKSATGTTGTGVSGATTTTKAGSNTKVNLVIWDDQNNEALTLAAVDYESKNKNVTVTIKQQGKTTLTALKMAVLAQTAPDIVDIDQVYSTASGNLGYLQDLNKYGAAKVKGLFIESCIKSITSNGKLYGLPFDANTIALMYNKTMFNKVGASVPKTYSEFVSVSNKIKAMYGTAKYAYTSPFDGWTDKNWMAFNYFFWLWRMGGDILSSDLKTAAFNSTAGISALQMLVDMKNNGLASPLYKHNEFFAGQVGMIDMGPWQFNQAFGSARKDEFGVALLPVLKTGVLPYSGLGLYCFGVTSTSKNPQAAYDFIQFYTTSTKYQLKYCIKNNLIPSLKAAHSDKFYADPQWKVMIQQLGYSKFRPGISNWDRMEETIADAVSKAVKGEKSPKEALDAAAKNVNRLIANNR